MIGDLVCTDIPLRRRVTAALDRFRIADSPRTAVINEYPFDFVRTMAKRILDDGGRPRMDELRQLGEALVEVYAFVVKNEESKSGR